MMGNEAMKTENQSNRRQRLKTLLNDGSFLLVLVSSLYLFVELVRLAVSKNGDNTSKQDRKREVVPKIQG